MARKIILIIMLIFLLNISLVFGVYGGETFKISDRDFSSECEKTRVKVFGEQQIDINEYKLIDCTEVKNNTWRCPCKNIKIKTHPATKNNYTFDIIVFEYTSTSSGGGSSRTYYVQKDCNDTNESVNDSVKIINNTKIITKENECDDIKIEKEDNETESFQYNKTNETDIDSSYNISELKELAKNKEKPNIIVGVIMIVVGLGVLLYMLDIYFKNDNR